MIHRYPLDLPRPTLLDQLVGSTDRSRRNCALPSVAIVDSVAFLPPSSTGLSLLDPLVSPAFLICHGVCPPLQ